MNIAPPSVGARAFDAWANVMLAGQGIGPADRIEVPYTVDCWIARRRDA